MAPRTYTDSWVKKAKWLTQALIISGTLNVGLLSTFIYLAVKDTNRPLEGKGHIVEDLSLSNKPDLQELLASYSRLSFQDLLLRLASNTHVESGYTRRDVALACLVRFHHFDIDRALGGGDPPSREISFTHKEGAETLTLTIFPGLADYQYQAIVQYAKTEKWPLTARGLFFEIQATRPPHDPSLLEAFYLTPEFHYIQLLFSKTSVSLKKEHLAALLGQGGWSTIEETAKHLRENATFTTSERRRFLLQLVTEGSKLAAKILVDADQEYCLKSLDNETVITLCGLLGDRASPSFLKHLLESPRSDAVWQKAAALLYEQAAEEIPSSLDLPSARRRFIELKGQALPPPRKAASYTVVSGDSLWKIARAHNTTVVKLREANSLKSDQLKVGQTLTIPN